MAKKLSTLAHEMLRVSHDNQVLKAEIKKLQGAVTGQQLQTDANASKWREKTASLEAELAGIRQGKVMACPCPVGQCRRLREHVSAGTCWYQWAYSRRGIKDMTEQKARELMDPIGPGTVLKLD